jgi:glutathione S-transferase
MALTLLYAPVSCALAPYVALTEAGADFEVRPIDHNRGEVFSPEFLALNPKSKLPVLLIDGRPLTENVAIQIWIARRYPAARLLPQDPEEEIRAISHMAFFASTIHPHLTPQARPQRYCDLPGSEDSVRRLARESLLHDLELCEDLLAGREWFFDHRTTVDIYFFWCFRRATLFQLDLSRFAACQAHYARMQQRPSVQKVLAYEQQVADLFRGRTQQQQQVRPVRETC